MKISHICQFIGVGGLEKVLHSLIKEQVKRGHEVTLIVYDHDRRWLSKFEELGITILDAYNKKQGYDWSLLSFLRESLKNAQIVHTHDLNPMLYVGPLKFLRLLPAKAKLVHTTHGMEHLNGPYKHKVFEMFLGAAAEKIICVSEAFVRHYHSQFGTHKAKIELIENGTPLAERGNGVASKDRLCAEFNMDPNKLIGIYVGRVCPMKGQLELIQRFESENKQLLIVGPASDERYFEQCKSASGGSVKMTGNRDDIASLLEGSDYFVSNSLHEGLPIAALEAGASGLPCYLSDIAGHQIFNREADCVTLFKDLEDLGHKIKRHSSTAVPLSDNLLNLIRKKFSAEAMERKYNSVYEGIVCSLN